MRAELGRCSCPGIVFDTRESERGTRHAHKGERKSAITRVSFSMPERERERHKSRRAGAAHSRALKVQKGCAEGIERQMQGQDHLGIVFDTHEGCG